MDQSSWENNGHSAGKQFPIFFGTLRFSIYKSLQVVSILSQLNPIHVYTVFL